MSSGIFKSEKGRGNQRNEKYCTVSVIELSPLLLSVHCWGDSCSDGRVRQHTGSLSPWPEGLSMNSRLWWALSPPPGEPVPSRVLHPSYQADSVPIHQGSERSHAPSPSTSDFQLSFIPGISENPGALTITVQPTWKSEEGKRREKGRNFPGVL